MKKTISAFMILVFVFFQSVFFAQSVETDFTKSTPDTFSFLVREMISEFSLYESKFQTSSIGSSDGFDSCRLIVKSSSNIDVSGAVSVISGYKNLWVLQYDSSEKARNAFEYYDSLSCVEYVEPDLAIEMCEVSSENIEPRSVSWGSDVIGADYALNALLNEDLNEIKVGVIDSGIDYNHEHFKGRVIDKGYNFSTSGDETSMSDDPKSHGTHVAGIIVDNTPENVKIKGYKIFSSTGNSSNIAVIAAVEQAVADGMDIINMSFSGINSRSVRECLIDAYNSGVTLVAATGNTYQHIGNLLPAALDEAISVTAIDGNLNFAEFSAYGQSVDLCAPGVEIYSAANDGSYKFLSGTSMAAPFVSACSAILLSQNDDLSPAQIEDILISGAIPLHCPEVYCGNGVVNAANIVECGRVQTVDCSIESGSYYDAVTISLTESENPIYYSTDGSYPNAQNGIRYESPVTVSDSAVFSWITESEDLFQSKSQSVCIRIIHKESEKEFEISNEGTILAYYGNKSEISIPETINSVTVASIGNNVFDSNNHPGMRTVIMPDSVKKIGADAFRGSKFLDMFEANGVEEISTNSFNGCTAITHFDFPSLKNILNGAFKNCFSLKSVEIDSTKVVDDQVFYGCISLESVHLPNVEYIGSNVFNKSGVNYLFSKVLKKINSFPVINNSVVFLPSSVVEIAEPQMNINLKVVASQGAFAENWARTSHEKCTTELVVSPTFISVPDRVIDEYTEYLEIDAIGFDLTYQWYGTYDGRIENGFVLSGETGSKLVVDKEYIGYFCVVTATDNSVVTSEKTDVFCYPEAYADYSGYEAAKKSVPENLSIYTEESTAKLYMILNRDISYILAVDQNLVDEHSRAIVDAVNELEIKTADYSAVKAAISSVPADLSVYTSESVKVLNETIESVDYNLNILQQNQVDEYAQKIIDATENLDTENWIIRLFRKIVSFFASLFELL